MNVTVKGRPLCGTVSVCASKSEAHRLLICSLLSCSRTEILCDSLSEDIKATAECIKAMGADVSFDNGVITVDSSMDPQKKIFIYSLSGRRFCGVCDESCINVLPEMN